jgi:hypothetical protein
MSSKASASCDGEIPFKACTPRRSFAIAASGSVVYVDATARMDAHNYERSNTVPGVFEQRQQSLRAVASALNITIPNDAVNRMPSKFSRTRRNASLA